MELILSDVSDKKRLIYTKDREWRVELLVREMEEGISPLWGMLSLVISGSQIKDSSRKRKHSRETN